MIQKILYRIRERIKKIDMSQPQIFAISFMMAGSFLTIISLYVTHGNILEHIFFSDTLDTGMDFFHSIEYVRDRLPYEKWNTLYPPLANLFFYLLFCVIPSSQSSMWADDFTNSVMVRGTYQDLRTNQAPMLLFILFLMITVLLLHNLISNYFEGYKYVKMISMCFIFNLGVLYAYERGNIIIISLIGCMYFLINRNSENKVKSELALICLAISAGLKIYPALLGIMLVYERQYKKAIKAIVYGILCFVMPCFVFKEGLRCIALFFNILFSHSNIQALACDGFSFDRILSTIVTIGTNVLQIDINEELLILVFSKLNIAICIVLLVSGFFLKKKWQQVLVCCMSIILYSNQGVYIIVFLLLPLMELIKEEKKVDIQNVIPLISMILVNMLLPNYGILFSVISPTIFRIQFVMLNLIIYVFYTVIKEMKVKIKANSNEG